MLAMSRTTAMYAAFLTMCTFVYWNLEAPEYAKKDYALTLAAGLHVLAFALLTCNSRSRAGEKLSQRTTLCLFFLAHSTRLSASLIWGHYTPEDNTANVYLYQLLELSGLLILAYQLRKMIKFDVGEREKWDVMMSICIDSLFLAFLTKVSVHESGYNEDFVWMFAFWIETFALVPEILILLKSKYADKAQLHFVSIASFSGVILGIFLIDWTITDPRLHFLSRNCGLIFAALVRVCLCITCFGVCARMSLDSAVRTAWAPGKNSTP